MESRVGWHRALQAAREFPTYVLACDAPPRAEIRAALRSVPRAQRPKILVLRGPNWLDRLSRYPSLYFLVCRLWHLRAFAIAKRLHRKHRFALTHQVNYCSYREPGYLWKLPIPFIWGPWGGTQNFPLRYLPAADWAGGLSELMRGFLNTIQLRGSIRLRQVLRTHSRVLVAHREAQEKVQEIFGIRVPRQLETGLAQLPSEVPRPAATRKTLRILWAGRLRTWKALPLLLHALHRLPPDVDIQLRVLGKGNRAASWKRLAKRLGVMDRIEWVGWPTYRASLEHYAWADVFVFTSLRDTSGTGLLEALAFGLPIIGLDHQGARDIMSDECAIRVPLGEVDATIDAIRDGIMNLANDRRRLASLSDAARTRAEQFQWDALGSDVRKLYWQAIHARGALETASLRRRSSRRSVCSESS